MAMASTPQCLLLTHELEIRFMKFNPKNPKWVNRDRFVLS